MNNEIQNSLIAKVPASRGTPTDNPIAQDAVNGNRLPPAEEDVRSQEPQVPDRETVEKAAEELTRRVADMGRDLRFDVDDDSGLTVIKVIDPTTEEVVRQIPSEEAVARAGGRSDRGFNLIDETA